MASTTFSLQYCISSSSAIEIPPSKGLSAPKAARKSPNIGRPRKPPPTHRPPGFPCQRCSATFSRKSHLKRHENTVHSLLPGRFICRFCTHYRASRKDNRDAHLVTMHGVDSLDVLAGKFDGDYEQEFPQCDHKEPIPPPVVRVDRSLLDHSHMMLFDTGEDSNNIAWNAPEWRDSSWNATAAAPAPWKNTASSYSSSSNPSTLHRIPPTTTTPPSITITTTPTPTLRTSPSRRSAAFILREREQRSHLIKQATRMVNRIISSSSSCSSSSGTASATDPSSSFTDGVSSSWFQ